MTKKKPQKQKVSENSLVTLSEVLAQVHADQRVKRGYSQGLLLAVDTRIPRGDTLAQLANIIHHHNRLVAQLGGWSGMPLTNDEADACVKLVEHMRKDLNKLLSPIQKEIQSLAENIQKEIHSIAKKMAM